MFKVNNKDTRTTPVSSLFTPCFRDFIVNFKQVNAGWDISLNSLRLYLTRIFDEFSLKPVYPTTFGKYFQIYGIEITKKYICESQNLIWTFLLISQSKNFSHPLAKGKLPRQCFSEMCPPAERWGRKLYSVKPYIPFMDQQVCIWFTIKIVLVSIFVSAQKFKSEVEVKL